MQIEHKFLGEILIKCRKRCEKSALKLNQIFLLLEFEFGGVLNFPFLIFHPFVAAVADTK
jgi:hypothetical protein